MNYRGTENIEINERKFSLEYIYHMFREGRIYFPMRSSGLRTKIEKELEQLLDAIWMGIPLPAIYASEQQNGDLLILEKNDNLWKLLHFLDGRYQTDYWTEENDFSHGDMGMLRSEDPRLAMRLYDTPISFQIIDYRTPKYLHMSIGKLVEHWSVTREQEIREALYNSDEIWELNTIARDMNRILHPGRRLNGTSYVIRYRTLYMLMNWFVYTGMWHDGTEMQEQLLLEETLKIIEWQGSRINELLDKTHDFADIIFYMDDVYKNRISKKTRNNIWNKYLGLFVCLLDIAKRRKADREYMEYILLERGVFYGICTEMEKHQLTKQSIEWAFQRWEREL